MKIEIITTPLKRAKDHQKAVSRFLDSNKFEQISIDNFVTAGHGGNCKHLTESATITTIIKY